MQQHSEVRIAKSGKEKYMSEREQEMLKNITDAISSMSEFQKGYFLGTAEAMAEKKKKDREEINEQKTEAVLAG